LPKFIAVSNQYLDQGMFFGTYFCTHMMRYETLQEDFDYMMGVTGLPRTDIPLKNVSHDRPDKPLSEYYDHRLIKLMKTHFNKEIRQNGYRSPCQAT
jgi:hypothetical protein